MAAFSLWRVPLLALLFLQLEQGQLGPGEILGPSVAATTSSKQVAAKPRPAWGAGLSESAWEAATASGAGAGCLYTLCTFGAGKARELCSGGW